MQGQLILAIMTLINACPNLNFIIETHSSSIIESIGRIIEEQRIKFDKDKVGVLLFEQSVERVTNIRTVTYSNDGCLEDWPVDFFQESEY